MNIVSAKKGKKSNSKGKRLQVVCWFFNVIAKLNLLMDE